MEWTIEEAQEHLDDVMTRALEEGPQLVRGGEEVVVVVSAEEFERVLADGSGGV